MPISHKIHEILLNFSLFNTIHEATRITQNTRKLIDPILVTEDISYFDSGTIDIESSVSDHRGTYISMKTSVNYNNAYNRQVWMYKQADFNKLNTLIKNTDWVKLIIEADSTNHAAENFSSTFLQQVSECIPEKSVVIRPRDKPWFDSALRKQIRVRNRLRKKARQSNKLCDLLKFKKARNTVNNMKKYAISNYYDNIEQNLSEACKNNKNFFGNF